MKTTANQRGFTIVEIIIAILVLTVGLLGLVTTAALVTRMIDAVSARARPQGSPSGASSGCARRLPCRQARPRYRHLVPRRGLDRGQHLVVVEPSGNTFRLMIRTSSRRAGISCASTPRRPRSHADTTRVLAGRAARALVLLAIVSTAVYRVLVNNQRLYVAQTQRIDLQQNIRAAETILPAEFRELDASEAISRR